MPGHALMVRDFARIVGMPSLVWRLPWWVVRRHYLLLGCTVGPGPVAVPGSFRWTLATAADVPHLRAVNPTLTPAEIGRRFQDWAGCVLAWADDTPAHYHWIAGDSAHLPYLGRRVRLEPGDYLIAESFTAPAHRRRGFHTATSLWCLEQARILGCRRVIGLIAAWNAPALHVARERMGRTVLGTVGHWRLGPLGRHVMRGAVTAGPHGVIEIGKA